MTWYDMISYYATVEHYSVVTSYDVIWCEILIDHIVLSRTRVLGAMANSLESCTFQLNDEGYQTVGRLCVWVFGSGGQQALRRVL